MNFLFVDEKWEDKDLDELIKVTMTPIIVEAINQNEYNLAVSGLSDKWYCKNPYMKEKILKQFRNLGISDKGLHHIEFIM